MARTGHYTCDACGIAGESRYPDHPGCLPTGWYKLGKDGIGHSHLDLCSDCGRYFTRVIPGSRRADVIDAPLRLPQGAER